MRPISLLCRASFVLAVAGCSAGEQTSARDIVTADPYRSLVFEIDAVAEAGPSSAALDQVKSELEDLRARGALGKPDGIEMRTDETLAASAEPDRAWSMAELEALASTHRSIEAGPSQLVVHLLYVDGHFEEDTESEQVLGLAIGHDLIAIFGASIGMECDALPPLLRRSVCGLTEASVLLHEVGHLMGLVNDGLPMVSPHQDAEHGAHDLNDECLMHYLADRSGFAAILADRARNGAPPPSPFCDACLADLTAAQAPPQP